MAKHLRERVPHTRIDKKYIHVNNIDVKHSPHHPLLQLPWSAWRLQRDWTQHVDGQPLLHWKNTCNSIIVYITHLKTSPSAPGLEFLIGTEREAVGGSSPLLATICFAMASLTSCSRHLLMLAHDRYHSPGECKHSGAPIHNVQPSNTSCRAPSCTSPLTTPPPSLSLESAPGIHFTDWHIFFEETMFLSFKEISKPLGVLFDLTLGFASLMKSFSQPFPSNILGVRYTLWKIFLKELTRGGSWGSKSAHQ